MLKLVELTNFQAHTARVAYHCRYEIFMYFCNMKIYSRRFEFLFAVLLLLASCTACNASENPSECNTSCVGVDDVGEMMRNGVPAEKYMAAQDRLVMQMRRGQSKDASVDILSQSGYFYMRQGDYVKALEYLHEASDSMASVKDSKTLRGMISLPGNLSGLYFRFGLYDDALHENAKAIGISRQNGGIAMSDLMRMRGAIYAGMYKDNVGNPEEVADSALKYFDESVAVSRTPATKSLAEVIRAEFFVNNPTIFPDSLSGAITVLRRIVSEDGEDATTAQAILGQALVDCGQYSEGVAYIKDAYDKFSSQHEVESEEWALGLLADGYVKAGRFDLLKDVYPQYKAMQDSVSKKDKADALIGAEYRYRVKEKDRQIDVMEERLALTRSMLFYQYAVFALLMLMALWIIIVAVKRVRKSEKARKEAQERIDVILNHQQYLNSQIEQLNQEIELAKSEKGIESVARQLCPSVLRDNDEKDFRQAFATLHPNFLRNMRRDFPGLTSNDELVCMLILLRFNTDEIAMSLGIARQSVISIRHRIRKKLRLEKGEDLDSVILAHE